jgi:hypothetical protein
MRVESGVSRSWRFHPTERSAAIRAPAEITAFMHPKPARLTMK